MYFRLDKEFLGDCTIVSHRKNNTCSFTRPLLMDGMDTFIRQNGVVPIVNKVKKLTTSSFDSVVSARDSFGMDVRAEGTFVQVKPKFSLDKKDQDDIAYYYFGWRDNGVGYINRNSVKYGKEWIDKPKVFIPCAWGNGILEDDRINPFLPEQSSVCFETYLMVGPFSSWN